MYDKKKNIQNRESLLFEFPKEIRSLNEPKEVWKTAIRKIYSVFPGEKISILPYSNEEEVFKNSLVLGPYGFYEADEIIPIKHPSNLSYKLALDYRTGASCIFESKQILIPIRKKTKFFCLLRIMLSEDISKLSDIKNLLNEFAEILADKLFNLTTKNQLQAKINQLSAQSRIYASLSNTLEMKPLLEIILESIVCDLGYDAAKIFLLDKKNHRLKGTLRYEQNKGFTSITKENCETIVHTGLDQLGIHSVSTIKRQQLLSRLIKNVELRARGQMLGVVQVSNVVSSLPVTDSEKNNLKNFVEQASIALDNARLYSDMEKMTIEDSLTGLYNIRFFQSKIEEEMNRLERYPENLSLLMLDLDNFKKFNDTHGHLPGDQLLKKTAAIIRQSIRENDIPARYGGDEFVILLLYANPKAAKNTAERIRKKISQQIFYPEKKAGSITISIGIAYTQKGTIKPKTLIRSADQALYQAKEEGRNLVVESPGPLH